MRIVFILFLLTTLALPQIPGQFNPAGRMIFARSGHTATLLPDGRVFFAGGICPGTDSCPSTTELYDPATSSSVESGNLEVPRKDHAAQLLPDGQVLLIGAGSAEIFDIAAGKSKSLDRNFSRRVRGQAATLADGRILLACGGERHVEILNPREKSIQDLPVPNGLHQNCETSVTLPGNRLLTTDIFMNLLLADLNSGQWRGKFALSYQYDYWDNLYGRTSSLLPNGKVVAAGGTGQYYPSWRPAQFFDLVDPDALSLETFNLLSSHQFHAACLSPDGLLLSGGSNIPEPLPWATDLNFLGNGSAELLRLDGSAAERRLTMLRPRLRHTCTLLNDGSVLLAGGESSGELERYWPEKSWPNLRIAAAVPVANGQAIELYASGILEDSKLPPHVWINHQPAPVLYFSPTQINVLIPEQLRAQPQLEIQFQYLDRTSNLIRLESAPKE